MATPSRPKKKAARKSAKQEGADKKAARKAAKKVKRKGAKTRGVKPARRSKAATKLGKKARSSARRGSALGQRPLLASARRPKARTGRGPSKARAVPRRHHPKRSVAGAARRPANGSRGTNYIIRDFHAEDAAAVNAVALAAFEQYRGEYEDWPTFSAFVGSVANLATEGELIVAADDGKIAGAVAYFGPGASKPAMFDPGWPVIRMLVVDPAARGAGLGRLLTEECISRARRDGADRIALHTSPIMQVALSMYLRSGFVPLRDAPPIFGVPYRIYLKRL